MSLEIRSATPARPFVFIPKDFEEAFKFAQTIANSDLAPPNYKGKVENTFIAMQMGAEVGLSPMQAIQNISVINGRPSIWGDAALALCYASPICESVKEWFEGDIDKGSAVYYCEAKRVGQEPVKRFFSIDKAKKAGLWGKQGPWTQYPERMLQMRARGFALRDAYTDILKGLSIAEESIDLPREDYEIIPSKNIDSKKGVDGLISRIGGKSKPIDLPDDTAVLESCADQLMLHFDAVKIPAVDEFLLRIGECATLDELEALGAVAKTFTNQDKISARSAYMQKRGELKKSQTNLKQGVNHER